MRCCRLEAVAHCLHRGAERELHLTPKPGLVDERDNGSHPDLDLPTMEASVRLLGGYLAALAASLSAGEPFEAQAGLGRLAEVTMRVRCGTNTHRGYVFLSGLMLAAFHRAPAEEEPLRSAVRSLAAEFFARRGEQDSHGRAVRRRFGAGGVVREAREGFPSLFESALPAGRSAPPETAPFVMMARLMQVVEDTTTLHRGGPEGLAQIRRDGRHLEHLLHYDGDWRAFLEERNLHYVRMNLTMGGVADMLALSLGYLEATGPALEAVSASASPAG